MIEVRGLNVRYGSEDVLENITFTIPSGQMAYYLNMPADPAIVLVNTAAFVAVLLLAPRALRLGV